MKLNEKLINDFKNTNIKLRQQFTQIKKVQKEEIRTNLKIQIMKKMSKKELKWVFDKGNIIGVDGSKNKIGNLYPHYLMAIQALAKSMNNSCEPIYESTVYTPITENIDSKEAEEKEKRIMATLEVVVAIKSIDEHKPSLIMMDGSLMSYKIRCLEEWQKLKKLCLDKDICLVGVIEEIKTKEMASYLIEKGMDVSIDAFDKEVLFGILEEGEYINISAKKSNKDKENLGTCFLRTSKDPNVIGLDYLEEQKDTVTNVCNLVYSLTPTDSRGIPIWLDIVDQEVKISDNMIKILVDTYIDNDLNKMFLSPKREHRSL